MDTMAKSFFVKSKKGIKYRVWKSTKSGYWYIELRRKLDKSLKTKNADQAKVVAQAMVNELDGRKISVLTAKNSKTISQYLEDYISDRSDLSLRTTNLDRTAIKCLIDVVGDIKVATIRPGHIKSFRKIHEYYIGPGKKKVISKTSVNTYLRHIKTFLNQANEDGILLDVPKIKMVKTDDLLPRILSTKERKMILNHTFKEDYEFHRIINFALFTGCRRHEIVSAKWENYDWTMEMIKVFGKGGKERQVPIIHEALFAMGKRKESGPIFKQAHPDTYTHWYKAHARAAGVPMTKFHDLRHSAATQMLEKGIRLEIIQEILGHADIKTTKIYAKVLNQTMREEMQKLSNHPKKP